jgi:hypothetical protein
MSMLCAKATRAKRSNSSNVRLLRPASARDELEQIRKEGREEWLRQRQQKGSSPTLEEIRAKGREDWLKLRHQNAQENSRDPQDRSAEKDQEAKPKDLSESQDKGLDDDLN